MEKEENISKRIFFQFENIYWRGNILTKFRRITYLDYELQIRIFWRKRKSGKEKEENISGNESVMQIGQK